MTAIAIEPPARDRRTLLLALVTGFVSFVTFFIVEHQIDSSTRSEAYEDANFLDVDLDTMVDDGSTVRKLGFLMFGLLGVGLLALPGRPLPVMSVTTALIIAGVALSAASVLWSVDPSFAAKRVLVLLLILVGVLGIVRQFSPRQTADLLTALAAAYIGLGVLAEIGYGQFRPWSGTYRFGGTTHPNTQGIICGLFLCSAAARITVAGGRRKLAWMAAAGVVALLLYLTKSRTTLAATVVACGGLLWVRSGAMLRLVAVVLGVGLVAGGTFVAAALDLPIIQKVGDALLLGRGEEASTLTGRLPLWAELNADVASRPVLGHGYGSFWTPDVLYRVSATQGWQPSHAHSGYYETALNLGLLGLLIVLVAMIAGFGSSLAAEQTRPSVASGLTVSFITFAAIYSLADTGFALPTLGSFALAVVLLQSSRLAGGATSVELPADGEFVRPGLAA